MFDQLFFRSDALTRQFSAPLVAKARLLLAIAQYLSLADPPNDRINLPQIEKAARRWFGHTWPSGKSRHAKNSRQYFITEAVEWLTSLNRFQATPKSVRVYDHMLVAFRSFMTEDRNLSPKTVEYRCRTVRPFLDRLLNGKRSLETITVSEVDALLVEKVSKEHYARISIRSYASSLRSFFRFAEMRGWCPTGIAASIMARRVFHHETLPSGPSWDIVQEIVDATAGDHPTARLVLGLHLTPLRMVGLCSTPAVPLL
jgi:hypothetical protein